MKNGSCSLSIPGLLKKLGRFEEAVKAYRRALSLVANVPEHRFVKGRLAEVEDGAR